MWKKISYGIDKMNWWIGRICSYLMLVLIFLDTFEVIMRYLFKHPTVWSSELNMQIWAFLIMMVGAYCYLKKKHVKVDVLYNVFPPKMQSVLSIITAGLIIMVMAIIIRYGSKLAYDSIVRDERQSTVFASPMWTIRLWIPIGCFLMILQAVSEIIKEIYILAGKPLPSAVPDEKTDEEELIEMYEDSTEK